MKCIRPIVLGKHVFGCKQCMPCLIDRRREWTTRILTEALAHEQNVFATLTYREVFYVQRSSVDYPPDASLRPKDLQGFLKRLRNYQLPNRFRFYACGEYGDHGGRAHFHLVLFGYPWCRGGPYKRTGLRGYECQCKSCLDVRRAWGFGHVTLSSLEVGRAAYIAKYITKKLTGSLSLKGRHPEFARMSLVPGIGATAMSRVVQAAKLVGAQDRLGATIAFAGKQKLPLGRYLKGKLYDEAGVQPIASGGIRALEKNAEAMRLLRMVAEQCNVSTSEVLREVFAVNTETGYSSKGTL